MKKKLLVLTIVLCFTTFAMANGQTTEQNTNVTNIQGQWVLGNGASNATFYSDAGIGLVNPAVPYHLQIGPGQSQIVLWNGEGFNVKLYEGSYVRKTVQHNLDNVGKNIFDTSKWFVGWFGHGFNVADHQRGETTYTKTDTIDLKSNLSISDIEDNYHVIYTINIGARKDLDFETALDFGLRAGMDIGGTSAVFSGGMNTIYNASSVGFGVSHAQAEGTSSSAATIGINLSDTKGQGEAALHLLILVEKTADEKAAAKTARTTLIKEARESRINAAVNQALFSIEVERRVKEALANATTVKATEASENAVNKKATENGGPRRNLDPTEHTREK